MFYGVFLLLLYDSKAVMAFGVVDVVIGEERPSSVDVLSCSVPEYVVLTGIGFGVDVVSP